MLIDVYTENWLDHLDQHYASMSSGFQLYLLLDGACVPGLHNKFFAERKIILFETLPACNQDVRDVSPFLTPYDLVDRRLKLILKQCSGWPMVSAIVTSESLQRFAERLAAWCIIETDGQYFNFRFSDTRRLPAIFSTFNCLQRRQFVGPAASWSYIGRDGRWRQLDIAASATAATPSPKLNTQQFSTLVFDSQVDEVMTLLHYRGYNVFSMPSRNHTLVENALSAVRFESFDKNHLLDWCEWYWKQGQSANSSTITSLLTKWKRDIENA